MVSQAGAGRTPALLARASRLRDQGKGRTLSFSPKVFLPLTQLCRDVCGYCVFRRPPGRDVSPYMSPEEVLAVAREGEKRGCREALLVLGERPEERYPEARRWLAREGFDSTVEYLESTCRMLLRETSLYPHSNAGTLVPTELNALKEVNVSLGLMLESSSPRLCDPGGPHEHAPSKHPQARLDTLSAAGKLNVPVTTGLLVGIGETARERTEALQAIGELHQRYGHIQEVIIQNFRAKAATPMRWANELSTEETLKTVAEARIILGPEMNVQVPPNLSGPAREAGYLEFLGAGINDWGGISPVTIDHVNPEAPWPHLAQLRRQVEDRNFRLRARFPLYPEFIRNGNNGLPPVLRSRLEADADADGFVPQPELEPLWEERPC